MIVKLTMTGERRCRIISKDESVRYEGGLNEDMIEVMKGRKEAYFKTGWDSDGLGLGDEVEGW